MLIPLIHCAIQFDINGNRVLVLPCEEPQEMYGNRRMFGFPIIPSFEMYG
jgi:hypothetical protein